MKGDVVVDEYRTSQYTRIEFLDTIPVSISLNKEKVEVKEGQSFSLEASVYPKGIEILWSTSDDSIATVDQTGKVTAVKSGTATITATTSDRSNKSATCQVIVTEAYKFSSAIFTDNYIKELAGKGAAPSASSTKFIFRCYKKGYDENTPCSYLIQFPENVTFKPTPDGSYKITSNGWHSALRDQMWLTFFGIEPGETYCAALVKYQGKVQWCIFKILDEYAHENSSYLNTIEGGYSGDTKVADCFQFVEVLSSL